LQAGLNQLNSQVSTMSSSSLPNLDLSSLPAQLQDLKNQVQALQGSSQADREKMVAALKATNTFQGLTIDQQAELVAAIENTPSSTADH
ncbi:YhgE/Pip domain-containing protein, partial [Streptococcus pyogenes]